MASTSVGQEGLDFHYFCKDIVHWDLPHSPEDMEQREGRIRRYLSLTTRQAISFELEGKFDSWEKAISKVNSLEHFYVEECKKDINSVSYSYFASGLFPEWVYQSRSSELKYGHTTRHILCYPFSEDRQRFEYLKEKLKLFRFALGQDRPDNLMEDMKKIEEYKELLEMVRLKCEKLLTHS